MSNLVRNPKDRFSRDTAHFILNSFCTTEAYNFLEKDSAFFYYAMNICMISRHSTLNFHCALDIYCYLFWLEVQYFNQTSITCKSIERDLQHFNQLFFYISHCTSSTEQMTQHIFIKPEWWTMTMTDRRTKDGQTPEDWYTVSSPCEPLVQVKRKAKTAVPGRCRGTFSSIMALIRKSIFDCKLSSI